MGALGQLNLAGTNSTVHSTADNDLIGYDLAVNRGAFADGERVCRHVAIYGAVDLHLSLRTEVADDLKVGADE
jgi:hypothetical protein